MIYPLWSMVFHGKRQAPRFFSTKTEALKLTYLKKTHQYVQRRPMARCLGEKHLKNENMKHRTRLTLDICKSFPFGIVFFLDVLSSVKALEVVD